MVDEIGNYLQGAALYFFHFGYPLIVSVCLAIPRVVYNTKPLPTIVSAVE